ncbi:hypothetical protein SUDANB145_01767 [Streptomyces sp. enrichment culture]
MPVSERQLAEFAEQHAWTIPFDTSPRHLAGPGDARHVTHGLAAAGWTRTSDPFNTDLALTSPDHRYRLEFTPRTGYRASWWHLRHQGTGSEAYWTASFGPLVPAEIIASLTDALVAPPPAEQPDPWQAADATGWARDTDDTARSGDGMCVIAHRPLSEFTDAPSWFIETCKPSYDAYPGTPIWQAQFHAATPAHLVSAFLTALTDTAPLQRGMSDTTAHHTVVKEPSPLSPQQVVAAHASRLKAIQALLRTARRRQKLATTAAPVAPTSAAPLHR